MISQRFRQYIEKENLFLPTDSILVALSGGADSVALLHLLLDNGYACQAAHCNFHLRGAESDRDEQFVHHLCAQLNVPLVTIDFDTQAYAEQHRISIEMAARELRYNWFEKMRTERQADWIAVAHHQDDSVETFLLNLLRGTGINGLLGIKPKNGFIVRPLLTFTRQELEAYLLQKKQAYVTDSTNLCDQYTRNKIRLKLLPAMEEINPSIRETLVDTAKRLTDVATLYQASVEKTLQHLVQPQGVHIPTLLAEPAPDTLLFEWLHPRGFNHGQLADIKRSLQGQAGRTFYSKAWKLVKDREWLLMEPLQQEEDTTTPPFQLKQKEVEYTPDFCIPNDKNIACLDADKLNAPIHLRKWKAGDSFIPFGMKGRKKVSDFLTDRKFSLLQKEKQWVLCVGNEIGWVIGERIDHRFCIDANTRRVMLFERVDPSNEPA